ncbi:GyrI-like domain-containing protein [Cytobacillus purgationiresistens]|uniref:Transcriptional regulator YdeE n=1 Tax=Cytobacillus purgationiresistens TaxID=863449 RepID=A0ABU0AK95_9BACI|nr:GyrI-like domain-containing protein [Cytobacillus purgationiresistens]MDQ0271679.1 putative transcriptional regulator YdeE [Cytobacillus purgationiresistens]
MGIEVTEFKDIPKGMASLTIPPQTYASIIHTGPSHLVRESYEYLHEQMNNQGLQRSMEAWTLEFCQEGSKLERPIELLDPIFPVRK